MRLTGAREPAAATPNGKPGRFDSAINCMVRRIGDDDARVLEPRRGRAAEHEKYGGKDGPGGMPAPAAEKAQNAKAPGKKMGKNDCVEDLHRGSWRNERKDHHCRRKEQRLRVGCRRMAAEMIGIPKRDLAV